jgi:hypothetical protein
VSNKVVRNGEGNVLAFSMRKKDVGVSSFCGTKWQRKQYSNMTIMNTGMHTKVPCPLEAHDPPQQYWHIFVGEV